MTQYQDLIERLKAATGPDADLDEAIHVYQSGATAEWQEYLGANRYHKDGSWVYIGPVKPYTASIDACAALIDQKLPARWEYHMGTCGEDDMPWASITEPDEPCRDFAASAPTIPLAMIEALLLALQSNEATNVE